MKNLPLCITRGDWKHLRNFVYDKINILPKVKFKSPECIVKEQGVESIGFCYLNKNTIVLSNNLTYGLLVETYMHECYHLYCKREGIYKNYHDIHIDSVKQLNKYRKVAMKAERYVHNKTTRMVREYLPSYTPTSFPEATYKTIFEREYQASHKLLSAV
jgi:hypothetical protein